MEQLEQIVPYLEALSQQQKQGSRLQFFMLSKTVPFLVRNGYYKQAVERSKKLLFDNKEHKTMCMHLQFELGNIYKNCLTDKENAIAAFTTFLEKYEHEALTPIAKVELEILNNYGGSIQKRYPRLAAEHAIPTNYGLSQNYPNPFNPKTTIEYQLAASSDVSIKIYNLLGHEVKTLLSGQQPTGKYLVVWNGCDNSGQAVSSGVYLYRIVAEEYVRVRKMVLMQ